MLFGYVALHTKSTFDKRNRVNCIRKHILYYMYMKNYIHTTNYTYAMLYMYESLSLFKDQSTNKQDVPIIGRQTPQVLTA